MPTALRHATDPTTASRDTRRHVRLLLLASAWLLVALVPPAMAQQAASPSALAQQQSLEQHRIDYLIASVAALKNASFIRNGHAYDASRAAAHMRLKWRFAGSRVKTAEDFIRYCGTASSSSGIKYTIWFADGHTVDAASFLREKLAEYRPDTGVGGN
jgi:hypothetical protein